MNLSLIAAVGRDRVIGKDNKLLWHIPEDFQHFKEITKGHCVIMGRKTWESIGRPLSGRKNIVVTRQRDYQASGASVVCDLDSAIALCGADDESFIIGGAELYRMALPQVGTMYITEVDKEVSGDAFFPEFNKEEWNEISRERRDGFSFVKYVRKTNCP